ncbi:MAG: class D beta-lactamase [Draconibacterium sp.]|nr:class D beta-lactamase [Draconibacterium sp.]
MIRNKLKNISLLILLSIHFLNLVAQNKSTQECWGHIFEKQQVNGTFVLHNPSSGDTKFYNKERSDSTFLPASTFKILNSLIALETNAVSDIDEIIKWDDINRGWDEWNKDQSMKTAMPVSCVWFYQELARRIGEEKMQMYLDKVGYGNSEMGGRIDNFWLEGDLRISANEQIRIIEKLILNYLPFDKTHQETVKKLMLSDSSNKYKLYSKTGWAARVKKQIGWFVGFVESNNETWIFALNMDINSDSDARYRKQITYEILEKEGIIEL